MKKIIEYEVQDVYGTIEEKLDLKENEHYLYKTVYKVNNYSCYPIPTDPRFVKVVNTYWLKHHKTYYNCAVIDNTEKTIEKHGYYDMNHYDMNRQFRTDFYGNPFKGEKLSAEQLKNPSYEEEL